MRDDSCPQMPFSSVREVLGDPGNPLAIDEDRNTDLVKACTEQIFAVSIIGWFFREHAPFDILFDRGP
jgi:hypothetical protein